MITMRFGASPAADARFAVSPLAETVSSIRLLGDPAARHVHGPWQAATAAPVAGLDLAVLRLLLTGGMYAPDFVHPPPTGVTTPDFGEEIEVMLSTPLSQVTAEISATYPGGELPPPLRSFRSNPAQALSELAVLLRAYWERAIAPYWPRIKALLEADVLYRACQMAGMGQHHMLKDIDSSLNVTSDAIRVTKDCCTETIQLDHRGLLFMPSVFTWPRPLAISRRPWQPAVVYPARGTGMLWHARPPAAEPLGSLLGQFRATILAVLDQPLATVHIAGKSGITPGGVSQHLAILHAAGLVTRSRAGRYVLYQRTQAGDAIVSAATAPTTGL